MHNLTIAELILSWKKKQNLLFFPEYFYVLITKNIEVEILSRREYV